MLMANLNQAKGARRELQYAPFQIVSRRLVSRFALGAAAVVVGRWSAGFLLPPLFNKRDTA